MSGNLTYRDWTAHAGNLLSVLLGGVLYKAIYDAMGK
jgi:hypothetical protein